MDIIVGGLLLCFERERERTVGDVEREGAERRLVFKDAVARRKSGTTR